MRREVGDKLAIVGGAIAGFSMIAGLCGLAESIHHWHLENVQAYLGLAFGGGIIGLIIAIYGITGKEQNSPSDSPPLDHKKRTLA